jgi:hypothetical protein
MNTKIVNIHKKHPYDVYVGRAGNGHDGYFGNPIIKSSECKVCLGRHLTRNETLDCFEVYFHERIKIDAEYAQRIETLRGKTLGCFCHPARCHAETYINYLNNKEKQPMSLFGNKPGTIPAFTHIKSNVKRDISAGLGACTAIIGANRSGKTAILDSIRLALTGKHPIGAKANALMQLRNEDQVGGLSISLQGEKGFAEFSVTGSKIQHNFSGEVSSIDANKIMPSAPISDILTGAARGKEALFERFGEKLDLSVTPVGLNDLQKSLWAKEVTAHPSVMLSDLVSILRKAKLARGRAITSTEKAINDQKSQLPIVQAELLPELKEREQTARAYESAKQQRERLAHFKKTLNKLDKQEADLELSLEEQRRRLSFAELYLENQRPLLDNSQCFCCGQVTTPEILAQRVAQFEEAVNMRKKSIASFGDAQERVRIETTIAELEKVLSTVNVDYDGPASWDIQTQIQQIEQAQAIKANFEREVEQLTDLKQEQAAYKTIEKEAAKLLVSQLKKLKATAESAVNHHMPATFAATLNDDGKWSVGGHAVGTLSGSELSALTLALNLAWTDASPIRVLLLDDEELALFDATNVAELFTTVSAAVKRGDISQACVATSRPGIIPESWTKIELR